jgi:transposase-like protein
MRNSKMQQPRRFTKELAEEAVRLVETSGRTQREIASDLGIGLSTIVRWIGRSRDRRAVDPSAAVTIAPTRSVAARCGSSNRCAYRAVVPGCV